MISPVLERASAEHSAVPFVKVDVDAVPEVAAKYNVSALPTVAVFAHGKMKESFVGAKDARFINNFIGAALKQ